jgi:Flp pilus assembly protein TadD
MHPRSHRLVPALALALAALASSCAPRDPAVARARQEAGLLARSQALIDSGNVLYRAKDFANAAKRYGAAAVVKPDDPAAYYGLGMALAKLGRDDDARTAYTRARELAQQAHAPADSVAHP